ncbi:lytic murein transglycosylase [Mesobacterium sp. TK19101]|uniref:Lytic murein transglycosylase n=1 Tax=Mesobacterium hydrothermale TaxID=3111907 RepID=A0ABU6HF05_9RHOB|nr:lytic murein transglycosylase [Mesobacterium sp. TK19101]MEC3860956.1 lytic murein transglycosylase [Mesobacterium sp. TK19101]
MTYSRRWILAGGATALLAGCGGGVTAPAPRAPVVDPGLRPQRNPGYDAWVAAFRNRAQARGITVQTLNAAFRGTGFLPGVVERDRNQTEFTRTLEDYLAITASEAKVSLGRAAFARHRALLAQVEDRYGVPAEIVAAVWGLESQFGTRMGDIPVVSATSTLAYDGRRGAFFERQLMAALRILQNGDIPANRMTGSWAGAMGHTQFIPTTFEAYAVDFRGDGHRDIWSADPTDALASVGNYLSKSGWRRGQGWGLEVRLASADLPTGRGTTRSVADWAAAGVRPARGGALPDHGPASVLLPSGADGPAFLVFRNFSTILRYNNSEKYALGVGHLSDRLSGAPGLAAGFPPDVHGLTIDDRKALQRGLNAAGFDAGDPDGVFGKKTEAAIRAFQRAKGLPVTGTPSRALLALVA